MANKALDETRKDTISIAMALQVQDITSQQIAGVVHLIESVRAQLLVALKSLDEENPIGPSANASGNNHSSIPSSFDIDATFSQSTERQAIADDVVKTWNGSTQQPLE
jgi:chemotaxis regulatin CheY-phosphate phosphatase CheZ